MNLAESVLLLVILFYLLCLSGLGAGVHRVSRHTKRRLALDELPSVSVVVAARNEAQRLPRLLHCLQKLDYPGDRLELILVDDRSEDATPEILAAAAARQPNLHTLRIEDTLPDFAPKKRALDAGIRHSRGEILLLTDADCTPPAAWVRAMISLYRDEVVIAPGYSPYAFERRLPALLQGMLSLDYFSLAAVAAGGIGLGRPLTAAGCNMSYRRKTFDDAGGFESIREWISGDDDLFLLHVARTNPGRCAYALAPEAHVPCAGPATLAQFWHQRIRYASKGLHYGLAMTAGLIIIYLLNLFLAAGPFLYFAGLTDFALLSLKAWCIKSAGEFLFLAFAARKFKETRLLKYFLPTAVLYPYYITLFALLGVISPFKWKDRTATAKRKVLNPADA